MSTVAERLSEVTERLDEVQGEAGHLRLKVQGLEAYVAQNAPFAREVVQRLTCATAIFKALDIYQGGAPGTPVADLMRALGAELGAVRALAEANMEPNRDLTGFLDDAGHDISADDAADAEEDEGDDTLGAGTVNDEEE